MRRTFSFLLVAVGALLVAATLAFVYVLRAGIGARPEPPRLEAAVARKIRHLAIPADARAQRNPVPATAEALAEARAHFADHCAVCHANDGSGDTKMGRALYPRAPDMRLPATQVLSDGEIFWIIENGIRLTGMPAWGTPGSEEESWTLVHFIRHLSKLTPQEKLEMEKLNPRGPEEWRETQEEEQFLKGEEDGATPDAGSGGRGHTSARGTTH